MEVEETSVAIGSHSVATEVLRHRLGSSERESTARDRCSKNHVPEPQRQQIETQKDATILPISQIHRNTDSVEDTELRW